MAVATSEIWIKKNKSASKIQEFKIKLKVSMHVPKWDKTKRESYIERTKKKSIQPLMK